MSDYEDLIDKYEELERRYATLARLHEVATERTVQLAGVIEKVKGWVRDPYDGVHENRVVDFARLEHDILTAADTVTPLREIRAKTWDEGDRAREEFTRAAYDPSVSARDALSILPKNPYREDTDRG